MPRVWVYLVPVFDMLGFAWGCQLEIKLPLYRRLIIPQKQCILHNEFATNRQQLTYSN